MSGLPNVAPIPGPALSRDDLVAALSGLEPGEYVTRDLLPRVNAWLENEGRAPVSAKTLGEHIGRVLQLERRRMRGNVSAWRVTPEALNGRDWFAQPS